jgi:kynurenine 3-monooxygenase
MAAASEASAGWNFDYVVVGAGPAGLAAAGFLAKNGARVAVFENRPRPVDVFGSYPVVLNARGVAALEQLDEAVAKRAFSTGMDVKELHIVPGNRTVAQVKTWGTGIMRDQMAQILLEAAEERENVIFFWEHKLKSIDFAAHSCTFHRPDGSEVAFTTGRLVAADGNRSRVRHLCEENVEGFHAETSPWGFQLRFMTSTGRPGQTVIDPANHFVLGDKGYVCQQPNGVWSVSLRVLPEQDEDFLTADEATEERVKKLREYTTKHAKDFAENLLDDEAYRGFYSCRAFDGVVVKCSCLNPAGWVCIIGDAAHAVQPATGEGINSGLEDAALLGAAVLENPEDPFAAYDARRREDAHALHTLALRARDKVVAPPPRQQAASIMVTIGLSVAKKLRIVEGIAQDYMLGEKARTAGVKGYAELVEMEDRQTRGLRKVAMGIGKVFRIPKEHPAPEGAEAATGSTGKAAQESSQEQQLMGA